jgi:hypothetical protein
MKPLWTRKERLQLATLPREALSIMYSTYALRHYERRQKWTVGSQSLFPITLLVLWKNKQIRLARQCIRAEHMTYLVQRTCWWTKP